MPVWLNFSRSFFLNSFMLPGSNWNSESRSLLHTGRLDSNFPRIFKFSSKFWLSYEDAPKVGIGCKYYIKQHTVHCLQNLRPCTHFLKMTVQFTQILKKVPNSTFFYLIVDIHDSPGVIFIRKWKIYSPHLLVCSVVRGRHCFAAKGNNL